MGRRIATSRIARLRVGMHVLMLLLGLVFAYDYLRQPGVLGYLLASILFLGYSSFRLFGYRRARKSNRGPT